MAKSKIAILYVGGSIGMQTSVTTGRIEPIESIEEIYKFLPELQKEVSLDFFSITTVGSSDVSPEHWKEIAQVITTKYADYDGFVVIHGTNTMTYSAAAIAFSIQNNSKPIVFTGALLPLNDIAGDGRMNLVHAIRAAMLDIAEVCIVVGAQVLRAVRTKKVDNALFHTFASYTFPSLADFNIQTSLHPWRTPRRKRILASQPVFETNIAVITLFPGISMSYLQTIVAMKPAGIVVQAYGVGMFPVTMTNWLEEVQAANIPVVLTSQTVQGAIEFKRYKKQTVLETFGCISAKNMTFECALVKFMWVLGQTKNIFRIKQMMEQDMVGELDQ